jgi:hypothetical protein
MLSAQGEKMAAQQNMFAIIEWPEDRNKCSVHHLLRYNI